MTWWPVAAGIAAVTMYALFVICYATLADWRSNPVGRSLMLSKAVIVLLLSHVTFVMVVGDYPWRLHVWSVLLVLCAIAGASQLVQLLRVQWRDSKCSHPRRRATDRL